MSLYIPNFSGKLNYPMHLELNQKSVHENYRSELKTNPAKAVDTNIEKLGSIKIEASNKISFSANIKVDYKIDLETHEVAIRVVDSESGEVTRKISGEDFLKLIQRIADFDDRHLDQIV